MYRVLSSRYGWTPDYIAGLSTNQKMMYLGNVKEDAKTGRQYRTFATMEAYHAHKASQS